MILTTRDGFLYIDTARFVFNGLVYERPKVKLTPDEADRLWRELPFVTQQAIEDRANAQN